MKRKLFTSLVYEEKQTETALLKLQVEKKIICNLKSILVCIIDKQNELDAGSISDSTFVHDLLPVHSQVQEAQEELSKLKTVELQEVKNLGQQIVQAWANLKATYDSLFQQKLADKIEMNIFNNFHNLLMSMNEIDPRKDDFAGCIALGKKLTPRPGLMIQKRVYPPQPLYWAFCGPGPSTPPPGPSEEPATPPPGPSEGPATPPPGPSEGPATTRQGPYGGVSEAQATQFEQILVSYGTLIKVVGSRVFCVGETR